MTNDDDLSSDGLSPRESEHVSGIYANRTPSTDFTERVVSGVRADGVVVTLPPMRGPRWRWVSAQVAATIAAFAVGIGVGGRISATSAAGGTVSEAPPAFVFLLHDAPESPPVDSPAELQLVTAYTRWANAAVQQAGDISGLRLSDRVEYLAPSSTPPEASPILPGVVGFFTVPSRSWEDAVRLARGHPHRAAGGWVEVRRIAPTN